MRQSGGSIRHAQTLKYFSYSWIQGLKLMDLFGGLFFITLQESCSWGSGMWPHLQSGAAEGCCDTQVRIFFSSKCCCWHLLSGFSWWDKALVYMKMFLCGSCLRAAVLIASSGLLLFSLWQLSVPGSGTKPFLYSYWVEIFHCAPQAWIFLISVT